MMREPLFITKSKVKLRMEYRKKIYRIQHDCHPEDWFNFEMGLFIEQLLREAITERSRLENRFGKMRI